MISDPKLPFAATHGVELQPRGIRPAERACTGLRIQAVAPSLRACGCAASGCCCSCFLCATIGVMLMILPWRPEWSDNPLLLPYPDASRSVMASGFARGVATGLGAAQCVDRILGGNSVSRGMRRSIVRLVAAMSVGPCSKSVVSTRYEQPRHRAANDDCTMTDTKAEARSSRLPERTVSQQSRRANSAPAVGVQRAALALPPRTDSGHGRLLRLRPHSQPRQCFATA